MQRPKLVLHQEGVFVEGKFKPPPFWIDLPFLYSCTWLGKHTWMAKQGPDRTILARCTSVICWNYVRRYLALTRFLPSHHRPHLRVQYRREASLLASTFFNPVPNNGSNSATKSAPCVCLAMKNPVWQVHQPCKFAKFTYSFCSPHVQPVDVRRNATHNYSTAKWAYSPVD